MPFIATARGWKSEPGIYCFGEFYLAAHEQAGWFLEPPADPATLTRPADLAPADAATVVHAGDAGDPASAVSAALCSLERRGHGRTWLRSSCSPVRARSGCNARCAGSGCGACRCRVFRRSGRSRWHSVSVGRRARTAGHPVSAARAMEPVPSALPVSQDVRPHGRRDSSPRRAPSHGPARGDGFLRGADFIRTAANGSGRFALKSCTRTLDDAPGSLGVRMSVPTVPALALLAGLLAGPHRND